MAKQVAQLTATLTLDTQKYSAALTRAKKNLTEFTKAVTDKNRVMRTSFSNTAKSVDKLASSIQQAQARVAKETQTFKAGVSSLQNITKQISQTSATVSKANATVGSGIKSAATTLNSTVRTGKAAQTASKKIQDSAKKSAKAQQDAAKRIKAANSQISRSFENLKNIVSGIVIAQSFYTALNAVQSVVAGMWDMAGAVEQAQASFTTMIGDADVAKAVVDYVQDYANTSAFTFETAMDASRQLLAYGFQLNNLGYLLDTIGDAAAAMGDEEAFGRIAKALGQIQTKGKLATQEVLQLTEAGIPAYQILKEELGLTKEQLADLGNQGISATAAINALTQGIEKRYGGAMERLADTLPGLFSNVKDTISYIGSELMQPLYNSVKGVLKKMAEELNNWVSIVRSTGIGGLFEHIVPESLQEPIRQLVANLDILRLKLMELWGNLKPLIIAFSQYGINLANLVLPAVYAVASVLNSLIGIISQNATATRILVGVASGLLVYVSVTKALVGLRKAYAGLTSIIGWAINTGKSMYTLAKSFMTAMVAGEGLKAVLTGGLGLVKLGASVAAVVAGIATVNGAMNKLSNSAGNIFGAKSENYLQPELKDTADIAGELNNSFEDAASGLEDMGDEAEKAGKKARANLQSFDEVFTIEEPDETNTDDLDTDEIFDFDTSGLGGALGDMSGELEDFLDGMDATTESWWDKMKKRWKEWWTYTKNGFKEWWENTKSGFLSWADYTVGVVKDWWTDTKETFGPWWEDTKAGFKTWWDYTKSGFSNWWTNTKGTVKSWWSDTTSTFNGWWSSTQSRFSNWWSFTKTGFSDWWSNTKGTVKSWWSDTTSTFSTWWSDTSSRFSDWWSNTKLGFKDWWSDTKETLSNWKEVTWSDVKSWASDTWGRLTDWWNDTEGGFNEWRNDTAETINDWWTRTTGTVSDWWNDTMGWFNDWWSNTKTEFSTWKEETVTTITDWWSRTKDKFSNWKEDTTTWLSEWWNNTKTGFNDWKEKTAETVTDWWSRTKDKFSDWWDNTSSGFSTWWSDTKKGWNDWKEKTKQTLDESTNGWYSKLTEFCRNSDGKITAWNFTTIGMFKNCFDKVKGNISDWVQNSDGQFATFVRNGVGKIQNFGSQVSSFIKGGFKTAWDKAWGGLVDSFGNIFGRLLGKMKTPLNNLITMLNGVIDKWNKYVVGSVNKIPGINIGNVSKIPYLAKGGIVNQQTLAMIGEGGRKEAVLPLENEKTMARLGSTIGNYVAQATAGNAGTTTATDDRPILYVGTLIADDRSLRELERRMKVVRTQEEKRRV